MARIESGWDVTEWRSKKARRSECGGSKEVESQVVVF
jgi:hypothetical protein